MTDITEREPKARPGYRWEYRAGCDCHHCANKSCVGRIWPHWREIRND